MDIFFFPYLVPPKQARENNKAWKKKKKLNLYSKWKSPGENYTYMTKSLLKILCKFCWYAKVPGHINRRPFGTSFRNIARMGK